MRQPDFSAQPMTVTSGPYSSSNLLPCSSAPSPAESTCRQHPKSQVGCRRRLAATSARPPRDRAGRRILPLHRLLCDRQQQAFSKPLLCLDGGGPEWPRGHAGILVDDAGRERHRRPRESQMPGPTTQTHTNNHCFCSPLIRRSWTAVDPPLQSTITD